MKAIVVTAVVAALLGPGAALVTHAQDRDTDRSRPSTFVKDSVITTKVKAKLAEDKMKTLLHISVDTDNKGAVLLSGTAATQQDIDRAVAIARATDGVTSVTNDIRIKKE